MQILTPGFGLLFWQTITFLVVLFILGKFVWKPIMKAIREREDNIEGALSAAESAKAEMANLKAENENLLKEARAERDTILKEAKANADRMIAEAKATAAAEGAAMIEKAQAAIQGERKAAVAEIKQQAASLSVEIAEQLLRQELKDKKAQEDLLGRYMDEANLTTA